MLKRCSPRRISALVTCMGNSFDSLPSAPLPVVSSVSSLRWPRATVPSVMGRAERPSAKKSLGLSGTYFGWSCMSCRQADSRRRALRVRLVRNFRYLPGLQRLQELASFLAIEERIGGFDAQEEPVPACLCEARHVERGGIGHGQARSEERPSPQKNR